MKSMKLIIGLGNPDKKYLNTRHNVGFIIIDQIATALNLTWQFSKEWNALTAKDGDVIFVKPQTYMNDSGLTVGKLMNFYKINSTDILVIHDDIDINLGQFKQTSNSGSGGHKGIESIIKLIGTKEFSRIKVGVATPELEKYRKSILGNRAHRFVLKNFPASEKQIILQLASNIKQKLGL